MTFLDFKLRILDAPLPALIKLVRQRFREVAGAQVAGSLTFTTLLALVPLVTVVLLVTSQFADYADVGKNVRHFLTANVLPDRAGKVITTYALQFSQKASNLTLMGTALLLATAVMLLQTIDRTLNSIWLIRNPRRWYVRLPRYWAVLTLGPLVFGFGVFLLTRAVSASLGLINEPVWVRAILYQACAALLLLALFSYLFHAVPNRRLDWRHSIIGAIVATAGAVLVQRLFGLYLSKLPNFTLIYGTFSVLPLFLLWLYFTWLSVLVGATVAAVMPDFQIRKGQLPNTPAGRLEAAMRLLQTLSAAQKTGQACDLNDLADQGGMSIAATEARLKQLNRAGLAIRSDNGDWLLSIHSDQISLAEALEVFLLDGRPRTEPEASGALSEIVAQLREKMAAPIPQLK